MGEHGQRVGKRPSLTWAMGAPLQGAPPMLNMYGHIWSFDAVMRGDVVMYETTYVNVDVEPLERAYRSDVLRAVRIAHQHGMVAGAQAERDRLEASERETTRVYTKALVPLFIRVGLASFALGVLLTCLAWGACVQ